MSKSEDQGSSEESRLHKAWQAATLLLAGLAITALVAHGMKSMSDEMAKKDFEFVCNAIQDKIIDRLRAHEQILRSGAAFIGNSEIVTRQGWSRFTENQKIAQQLPGIQGIGFALQIPRQKLAQHVREIRAEGFPAYQVWPTGGRETYSSIIYLEPFSNRNLRAFGYDMYSEPVRREAMARARDQNSAALSGKVVLVQETDKDIQAGTLMYVPVYRTVMPHETIAQRRAAILGWVYSPYRMTDLMQGILGGWNLNDSRRIRLRIFDGESTSPENLLCDSLSAGEQPTRPARPLTWQSRIILTGHPWTLRFEKIQSPPSTTDYGKAWLVLFSGTSISLLLSWLFFNLSTTRLEARRRAARLTMGLRLSEEKHRLLIENSHDIIYLLTAEGVFTFVSSSWTVLLGHQKEQVVGRPFQEFVHPDDLAGCMVFLQKVIGTGQRQQGVEYRVRHEDGSWYWHTSSAVPLRDEAGTVIGFEGLARDITERKKAEASLKESKAMVEAIVESAPIMIFLKESKDLRFVLFNRAGEELLGYPRKDLIGKNDLDFFPPEQAAHFIAKDREVLNGPAGVQDVPEEPITTAKKGLRLLHTRKVCIRDTDGTAKYLLGISEDITEIKRAETARGNMQKLESLGTLAGGIAHDFNNILTAILGNLSLLQSEMKGESSALELVQEAQAACMTAKGLSQQLLTFAKGGTPVAKVMDLRSLLTQASVFAARGSHARCVFDLGESPLAVNIDKDQISQVIQNLVINATQAMQEGGTVMVQAGLVTVSENELPPLPAGRYVRVTVKDQGAGIAPAHLSKIFEPYFSTKGGGRGLGLAVCYSIMTKHDGLISADSKPGEGAVFTLCFPVANAADLPPEVEPAALPTGSGKVLIMDDEPSVSRVLKRMLERMGYQAEVAEDGQAALDAYKAALKTGKPYDAVIMDLTIPGGMGGKEAIVELSALDPKAKAIVSSGYSNDPVMSEYAASGFCGALSKPYKLEEVSEALRRAIGSKRS